MADMILMEEAFWANTPLSMVRHTGQIKMDGKIYVIVDKRGKTVFECTIEAEKAGRDKAIEPGEPCDLVNADFVPLYRELGRDEFLRFLKENPDVRDKNEARKRMKKWQQGKTD